MQLRPCTITFAIATTFSFHREIQPCPSREAIWYISEESVASWRDITIYVPEAVGTGRYRRQFFLVLRYVLCRPPKNYEKYHSSCSGSHWEIRLWYPTVYRVLRKLMLTFADVDRYIQPDKWRPTPDAHPHSGDQVGSGDLLYSARSLSRLVNTWLPNYWLLLWPLFLACVNLCAPFDRRRP